MKASLVALAVFPFAMLGAQGSTAIQAPEVQGGYLKLGFDLLSSFKFIAPEYDPAANPKTPPRRVKSRSRRWSRAGTARRPS